MKGSAVRKHVLKKHSRMNRWTEGSASWAAKSEISSRMARESGLIPARVLKTNRLLTSFCCF